MVKVVIIVEKTNIYNIGIDPATMFVHDHPIAVIGKLQVIETGGIACQAKG